MPKSQSPLLSFENALPPKLFIEKAAAIGASPDYDSFSRTEKGFSLLINTNHGGEVYFRCEISPNTQGGSIINGEIISIPWNTREQTTAQKIRDWILVILVCIIFFPITIGAGIEWLISRFSKKRRFSPDEKRAINFMTKTLNCTYKEIIE